MHFGDQPVSNARPANLPGGARSLMPDRVSNLLRYYVDCAREDEGHPIRVLLGDSGKRFIPWKLSSDWACHYVLCFS